MLYGSTLVGLGANPSALAGKFNTEAQRENAVLFEELFNRFSNIAVTRYEWNGLPSTVSERFLNQTLYLLGQSVWFDDYNLGILALPCTIAGEYNMYYEPTRVNAYSFNYNKTLTMGEFVFVRNNPTCTPTAFPVFEYTRRMADVLRTIDVLCKKLKQPFIFVCDEKERMTYLNMMKKVTDNEVVVLGSKSYGLNNSKLDVIDTKVDPHLTELWEAFHNLETLLYTALGIECVGQEKKERLLVDEVNSNNMVTQMSIDVNLKELQTACEEINKKWGLNVEVKAKGIAEYRMEVGPDGAVYDNPKGID